MKVPPKVLSKRRSQGWKLLFEGVQCNGPLLQTYVDTETTEKIRSSLELIQKNSRGQIFYEVDSDGFVWVKVDWPAVYAETN